MPPKPPTTAPVPVPVPAPGPLLSSWLTEANPPPAATVRLFHERPGVRAVVIKRVGKLVVDHYVHAEAILKMGGYGKAAALIRNSLPEGKRTRSGDLGEILAAEYINAETIFQVPIRKLQWKSDRAMPMHGNDIIAIGTFQRATRLLKGECKSAASFSNAHVSGAISTLDAHGGRPNPSSVAFIIKRLYEQGRDSEARVFEQLLCASAIKPTQITHHLFALCGNDPSNMLSQMPAPRRRGITRLATGIIISNHNKFVADVFKAAYGTRS